MKKIAMSLVLTLGITGFIIAQDTTRKEYTHEEPQIVNEKIETRELPDAVQQALQGQDYRGWLVNTVYKAPITIGDDPEKINKAKYIVELINGNEKKTIAFDKDGKKLNESDGDR